MQLLTVEMRIRLFGARRRDGSRIVDALIYPVKLLPAPLAGTADDGRVTTTSAPSPAFRPTVLPASMTATRLPIAIEILGRLFSEA